MPAGNMLEAFFVSLGWDTREFDRGRREIDRDLTRTKESARSAANDMETSGKRASEFFRGLRNETVGLFLAFQGASSLRGFLGDLIDSAARTDRLAKNMGVARNELYAWQNLVRGVGGNATDATSALQQMATQIQDWRLGIKTGNEGNLAGLGVTSSDFTDPANVLLKISEASGRMGRPEFAQRLGMMGFSPEMIDLMSRGRGELEKQLGVQKQQAEITDRDVEAARRFQRAWADTATSIRGIVMPELTDLLEGVDGVLKGTTGFTGAAPGMVVAVGAIGAAAALAAPPWLKLAGAILAAKVAGDQYLKNNPGTTRWLDSIEAPFRAILPGWLFERPGDVNSAAYRSSGGSGQPAGASGNVSGLFSVLERAYGTERARGIWAGIGAESGWNPNAFNSAGGGQGAYGLGQWRGKRLAALRARYGRNPTAAQQIDFLMSELNGGDAGGSSVLAGGSAADTLNRYVYSFMRPGAAGGAGDIRRGMQILGGSRAPVTGSAGSTGGTGGVTIGTINVNTPDAQSFANTDLPAALKRRGLVVQATTGISR